MSPLLARFHFYEFDHNLSRHKSVRYVRFMDDFLSIARTRWQLGALRRR